MSDATTLLTTAQAALELGVSQSQIEKWITKKRLLAQRIGRDWLIPRKNLDAVRQRNPPGRPVQHTGSKRVSEVKAFSPDTARRLATDKAERNGRSFWLYEVDGEHRVSDRAQVRYGTVYGRVDEDGSYHEVRG